eukprot:COSAG03_NODE_2525_length_2670_cov_13.351225_1_plen_74_part_10
MQAGSAQAAAAGTIEFFTHRWCPFAHRVWLSLEDKALPYKLVEIDLYIPRPLHWLSPLSLSLSLSLPPPLPPPP